MVYTVLAKEIKIPDTVTVSRKRINDNQARVQNLFFSNKTIDPDKLINTPPEHPIREVIFFQDEPRVGPFIGMQDVPQVDEVAERYEGGAPEEALIPEPPECAGPGEERGNDPRANGAARFERAQPGIIPENIPVDSLLASYLTQNEKEDTNPKSTSSFLFVSKEEPGSSQPPQSFMKRDRVPSHFRADAGSLSSSGLNSSQPPPIWAQPLGFQDPRTTQQTPSSKDSPTAQSKENHCFISSSHTALKETDLKGANEQLISSRERPKSPSLMQQKKAFFQCQNRSSPELDLRGTVSIRDFTPPLQRGNGHILSSPIQTTFPSGSKQKDTAYAAGLIPPPSGFGDGTGKTHKMTGKASEEEISHDSISCPLDPAAEGKKILPGLLKIDPQERLEVTNSPLILNVNPLKSSPALPLPLSYSHLSDIAALPRASSQEGPHSPVLPLPSSTLLLSNSSAMNKQTPSEKSKKEEKEEENGFCIEAVLFGSEELLMTDQCLDSELLSMIEVLKKNAIRTSLIAYNDDPPKEWHALFDVCHSSSKLGLDILDWKAYDALLEAIDLPANQILFIDRDLATVKAAQIMGFHAIVFTSSKQLKEDLSVRNLLEKKETPRQS